MAVTPVASRIVSKKACQSITKECKAPAVSNFHTGSCHSGGVHWSQSRAARRRTILQGRITNGDSRSARHRAQAGQRRPSGNGRDADERLPLSESASDTRPALRGRGTGIPAGTTPYPDVPPAQRRQAPPTPPPPPNLPRTPPCAHLRTHSPTPPSHH